uniref:Uncharacterized protein n=1 Tax=Arundo donax TaxID=35708 RepID=A0A0A9A499_ARUDO
MCCRSYISQYQTPQLLPVLPLLCHGSIAQNYHGVFALFYSSY